MLATESGKICKARELNMAGLNRDLVKYPNLYQSKRTKKFKVR